MSHRTNQVELLSRLSRLFSSRARLGQERTLWRKQVYGAMWQESLGEVCHSDRYEAPPTSFQDTRVKE